MRNIVFVASAFLVLSASTAHAGRISCKDFSNQAQAQKYFKAKKKGWKLLDRDKDGEACECLNGGSRYTDGRCKSWRAKNNKR